MEPVCFWWGLIITHKFLELPVERDAKAEIMPCFLNATWLVTMARKNIPNDMGNDKGGGRVCGNQNTGDWPRSDQREAMQRAARPASRDRRYLLFFPSDRLADICKTCNGGNRAAGSQFDQRGLCRPRWC